jgi:hypothetical protein
MWSRGVSSACSTCGTRRVSLVTHPMISYERGKDLIVIRHTEDSRGHL